MIKIGVIGTGHMGRNHVRVLSEEKRFNLEGVFDADKELAKKVALQYQIKAFETLDSLLSQVDAVVVATPSSLHKEISLQVAKHGVHALVEKPLATTSEDAETIVEAFRDKNLKLAVGHIERFNPVFRELNKLVNQCH